MLGTLSVSLVGPERFGFLKISLSTEMNLPCILKIRLGISKTVLFATCVTSAKKD